MVFLSSTFFSFAVVVAAAGSILAGEFLTRTGVLSKLTGRVCVSMRGAVVRDDVVVKATRAGIALISDEISEQVTSEAMVKQPDAVFLKLILMKKLSLESLMMYIRDDCKSVCLHHKYK